MFLQKLINLKTPIKYLKILVLLGMLVGCRSARTTIAFGSCASQEDPQPILQHIADRKVDYFVYLGDNIYGDTYELDTLKAKYQRLAAKPEFQNLWKSTKVLATWDDHDYGWNDSGKEYPLKEESRSLFFDFFKISANHPRRSHPGIYGVEYAKQGKKVVQFILLDNRTFRDSLVPWNSTAILPRNHYFYTPDYIPQTDPKASFLGEEQWKWLESTLKQPADLRIICSGSQYSIEYNGYEAWANFPHEKQRMANLIKSTGANGVMFISGDVHYAEISKWQPSGQYPLYDVTSSGITSTWDFATLNQYRIEGPVMENHFGLITITWKKDPEIRMQIFDVHENERIEYSIKKTDISF